MSTPSRTEQSGQLRYDVAMGIGLMVICFAFGVFVGVFSVWLMRSAGWV